MMNFEYIPKFKGVLNPQCENTKKQIETDILCAQSFMLGAAGKEEREQYAALYLDAIESLIGFEERVLEGTREELAASGIVRYKQYLQKKKRRIARLKKRKETVTRKYIKAY